MTSGERHVAYDHIVYLLGKDEFENLPRWLTDNFNVIDGGTHAGGSSRNKLIIFKDGTYLELFNWIEEPKEFLAWANKPPGLIDFALTSLPPSNAQQNFIAISQGLESGGDAELGVAFDHPRAGGRKRKDGVDVKWETTRTMTITGKHTPDSSFFPTERLDVPFFCHDITERTIRVPFEDNNITKHPCGAVGIADGSIVVPEPYLEHYITLYRNILGVLEKRDDNHPTTVTFEVVAPRPQGFAAKLTIEAVPELAGSDADESDKVNRDWLVRRGIGIRRLGLSTVQPGNSVPRCLDDDQTLNSITLLS